MTEQRSLARCPQCGAMYEVGDKHPTMTHVVYDKENPYTTTEGEDVVMVVPTESSREH